MIPGMPLLTVQEAKENERWRESANQTNMRRAYDITVRRKSRSFTGSLHSIWMAYFRYRNGKWIPRGNVIAVLLFSLAIAVPLTGVLVEYTSPPNYAEAAEDIISVFLPILLATMIGLTAKRFDDAIDAINSVFVPIRAAHRGHVIFGRGYADSSVRDQIIGAGQYVCEYLMHGANIDLIRAEENVAKALEAIPQETDEARREAAQDFAGEVLVDLIEQESKLEDLRFHPFASNTVALLNILIMVIDFFILPVKYASDPDVTWASACISVSIYVLVLDIIKNVVLEYQDIFEDIQASPVLSREVQSRFNEFRQSVEDRETRKGNRLGRQ